jgi:hypothetical protein
MDAFWLIPSAIVAIAFLVVFYAYIKTLPLSPSTPQVLVDKPSDALPIDEAAAARQWDERPCASYLEWLSARDE